MPILYYEQQKIFKLDTPHTTYAIQVTKYDFISHLYYGKTIQDLDLSYLNEPFCWDLGNAPVENREMPVSLDRLPLEYPCSGISDFREPALQILDDNGQCVCDIRYTGHRIYPGKPGITGMPATFAGTADATTLEIDGIDPVLNLKVTLIYTVFEKLDAITRSVRMTNQSEKNIRLQRALSLCLDLPHEKMDMIHLSGTWSRERAVQRHPLHSGKQAVDSLRGASSHQQNPFIALAAPHADEDQGEVYGCSFVYSGSFYAEAEVDQFRKTRLVMGIHPHDFSWLLAPAQTFETPEAVLVYSDAGLGKMSRTFHDLYRGHLIRSPYKDIKRPVLVNNWEATYFQFDTEKILSIARDAAELGMDMFVLDDGWFGHRDSDNSSLGDWFVYEQKLPGGLKHLVDTINQMGLKFGLWFEPEMISPDSDLYRAHPDWCIHVQNRTRSLSRTQLVLDMSRPDVRAYLFERISAILSSANIEYVKWDMNRTICEPGSAYLPAERQGELKHRYILGVYALMEQVLQAFPKLLLENCAGGGGRFDPGMLYYSPQIWTSDNTDAIDRLRIQHGTSYVYPVSAISAHVSACPNHQTARTVSLKTRAQVALCGTFGYELDLNQLSQEEKEEIKEQIREYHQYNDLIRSSDYYRLGDPFHEEHWDAWQFVSKDQSETLFQYIQVRAETNAPVRRIRLKGLNPALRYTDSATGKTYYGSTLMHAGIVIPGLWGDYAPYRLHLQSVPPTDPASCQTK